MQASWLGPFQIKQRLGEHSWIVQVSPRDRREVHADQLKPCWTHPATNEWYHLVYRRGDSIGTSPEL